MSRNNRPYFNMNLQSSEFVNQVVCFSPTKRQLFEDAHTNNVGVSMKNVKCKGDGTIFVGESGTVKIEKLGFKPNFLLPLNTIAEVINEVPAKSKINVCGHLLLDEITSAVVKGANIPIRRGHICDSTGHIKITLWREYVNVLHDTSYAFSSVVKSIYNNCPEIQTGNSTSFKKCDPVPDIKRPQTDDNVTIETTFFASAYICRMKCLFCNTDVIVADDKKKIIDCEKCGGTALFNNMDSSKFWNVIIVNNNIHVKLRVTDAMVREAVAGGSTTMAIYQIKLAMLTNKYIITYNPVSGNVECMVSDPEDDEAVECDAPESILNK